MGRGGGNINWDDVRADFGSSNQALGAAIGGISQAGTIFGNLRKSILDEEQRVIDNAYREKELGEKTRQFEATHGLDVNKFGFEQEKETTRGKEWKLDFDQKILENTADREARERVAKIGVGPAYANLAYNKEKDKLIKENEQAISGAMEIARQAATGFDSRIADINNRINNDLDLSTEGYVNLLAEKDDLAKASARATSESGKELLFIDALTKMGKGHLVAGISSTRAQEERTHGRTLDIEGLKANAKWTKHLQDNKQAENKAAVQTAKILSGMEDGVFIGDMGTQGQLALTLARKAGISEQKILEAFSSFSTKDDNWFFDTPMQKAIKQFNQNGTGRLAEALGVVKKEEPETTPPPTKKEDKPSESKPVVISDFTPISSEDRKTTTSYNKEPSKNNAERRVNAIEKQVKRIEAQKDPNDASLINTLMREREELLNMYNLK